MRYRPYETKDYSTVTKWWVEHGWVAVPELCLSDAGIYIEDNRGNGLACGWYGRTNSKTALLEWIVTNPSNTGKESYKSIDMIEKIAYGLAKEEGYKLLLMFLENNGLMSFLEKRGWQEGDSQMNIFTKGIV